MVGGAGLYAKGRRADPIDLTGLANMGFKDETGGDQQGGWTDQGGNDFRHMPVGQQTLCGVPFRIIDPAENAGKSCVVLRGHDRDYFPDAVNVKVGRKASAIGFLHTLAWAADKPAARYVFRYADGQVVSVPIRQGREILGWWGRRETDNVKIAVASHNLATRLISLHAWVWRNPRPGVRIESMQFRSTGSEAVPVIVAATALDNVPALRSELSDREVPADGFVMIEAEDFDSYNVPPTKENGNGEKTHDTWPDPRFSGGELFEIRPPRRARNPARDDKPRYLKDGALKLTYSFTADRADTYTFWARVGPARVYSPFRWRIDDGRWGTIGREDPFLDMWHISFWVTMGWVRLGERALGEGKHVLHLEVPRPTGGRGRADAPIERELGDIAPARTGDATGGDENRRKQRWVVMADCLAVSRIPFHPCGKLKAGQRLKNKPWLGRAARSAVVDLSGERFVRGGSRQRFWLDGVWEMDRDQEPIPSPHLDAEKKLRGPLTETPPSIRSHWMAVRVPHTRGSSVTDMLHRRWYRRYFSLPADLHERRLSLNFSEANYTASVFVNGQLCGTHFGGYVPFSVDITDAVRPDALNEIMVGIKGLAYYRKDYRPEVEDMNSLWHRQMLVPGRTGWHKKNRDGLPGSVWLETHGQVVSEHLYVRSRFREREITASVEIDNRSGETRRGEVRFTVLDPHKPASVSQVGSARFRLTPGERTTAQVTGPADMLEPWFPGRPRLYRMRAEIMGSNGERLDRLEDTFGFREVDVRGREIYINDRRFNFRSVITGGRETLKDTLSQWTEYNCNTLRLPHGGWNRYFDRDPQRATLDFTDEEGMAVRMNSQINGMFIDLATGDDRFWENATDYYRQFVKAYRNHPSIIIWTAENELDLISNMAGHRWFKRREWKMIEAASEIDPSRPTMADGAGTLDGKLPICNWHYCEVGPIADPNDPGAVRRRKQSGVAAVYPDNAFTFARLPNRNCRQRPWNRQRPLWVGESYFYSGQVKWQGWIGGDRALSGRFAADRASARFVNMLCRGYRWQDVAGFNIFTSAGKLRGEKIKRSLAPVAVFSRDYHHNHYAGERFERRLKIFNDTLDEGPLTLEWTLQLNGKTRDSGRSVHSLEPGDNRPITLKISAPRVKKRSDGELSFWLKRGGQVVFEESHPISIFPRYPQMDLPERTSLLLIGGEETVAPVLRSWGLSVQPIRSIPDSPGDVEVLIIGPDALKDDLSGAFQELNPWVAAGGRLLVLEQNRSFPEKALPLPLKTRAAAGSMAYPRGEHPALAGVKRRDMCIWGRDQVVFRWPFVRDRNWPLLVDAGTRDGLDLSPVVESRWGRGHYLLCQVLVGEKLGEEPMADRLMAGFLRYLSSTDTDAEAVKTFLAPGSAELSLIQRMGYRTERHSLDGGGGIELEVALGKAGGLVVLPGTPGAVRALRGARDALGEFVRSGGWVLLCGIEKDALDHLSELVGARLIHRPVGQERIVVRRRKAPLLRGIGNHEFYWAKKMKRESAIEAKFLHGDRPLQDNVFSGAILYEDICALSGNRAVSNHLTSEDHWKYISYRGDTLRLNWRRPFEIHRVVVRENRHYKRMQEIALTFGGQQKERLTRKVPLEKQPIVFEFAPRDARSITLRATRFKKTRSSGPFGWDTVEIYRTLPESFRQKVVPLTRPAGIVKFPMGRGGILLNMTSLEHRKGQRVLMQLLHNLGAGRTERAGDGSELMPELERGDSPPSEDLEGLGF